MEFVEPLQELLEMLAILDQQQAAFQAKGFLAHQYAMWCNAMFAEIGCKRSHLEQIIRDWEEADRLYEQHGVYHEPRNA